MKARGAGKNFCEIIARNVEGGGGFRPPPPALLGLNTFKRSSSDNQYPNLDCTVLDIDKYTAFSTMLTQWSRDVTGKLQYLVSEKQFRGCNIKLCNQLLFSNQLQKCCSANHGYCYMRDMMKHDLWLAELQFCNWLLNSHWLQSFMLHPCPNLHCAILDINKYFAFFTLLLNCPWIWQVN